MNENDFVIPIKKFKQGTRLYSGSKARSFKLGNNLTTLGRHDTQSLMDSNIFLVFATFFLVFAHVLSMLTKGTLFKHKYYY